MGIVALAGDGPDITGGTGPGGHLPHGHNPAQNCYLNVMGGVLGGLVR